MRMRNKGSQVKQREHVKQRRVAKTQRGAQVHSQYPLLFEFIDNNYRLYWNFSLSSRNVRVIKIY